MASSASLLQRLLRRPWKAGPPKWNGERPCRAAAPLVRTLRNTLSAKDPHGDSPLGGDLQCAHTCMRDSEATRKRRPMGSTTQQKLHIHTME